MAIVVAILPFSLSIDGVKTNRVSATNGWQYVEDNSERESKLVIVEGSGCEDTLASCDTFVNRYDAPKAGPPYVFTRLGDDNGIPAKLNINAGDPATAYKQNGEIYVTGIGNVAVIQKYFPDVGIPPPAAFLWKDSKHIESTTGKKYKQADALGTNGPIDNFFSRTAENE